MKFVNMSDNTFWLNERLVKPAYIFEADPENKTILRLWESELIKPIPVQPASQGIQKEQKGKNLQDVWDII